MRDVEQGPDGSLWMLEDANGGMKSKWRVQSRPKHFCSRRQTDLRERSPSRNLSPYKRLNSEGAATAWKGNRVYSRIKWIALAFMDAVTEVPIPRPMSSLEVRVMIATRLKPQSSDIRSTAPSLSMD